MKTSILPKIGDKVRLVFTGEIGEVVRIIDRETVAVRMGSDVIPIFGEHLEIIPPEAPKNLNATHTSTTKGKPPAILTAKTLDKNTAADRLRTLGFNTLPDNLPDKGLRLAMQPFYHPDGLIDYFLLHLINDSGKPIEFSYRLFLDTHDKSVFSLQKIIGGRDTCILNSLQYDDMNESPELQFDFTVLSLHEEDGDILREFERDAKPKARLLRNPPQWVGQINDKAYLIELCPRLPRQSPRTQETPKPDLPAEELHRIVTEKLKTQEQSKQQNSSHRPKVTLNAHLRQVDLHIEKLLPAHKHLSNGEIIQVQLRHFKQQLEEAIRRHEGSMVVIHGLGKGKLKQEIWKLLLEYTEVAHFDNDYDHRFGFGATLIEFGQR